jgi:hypothetical protein
MAKYLLKPLLQSNINNLENQNVMGRTGRSMKQVVGRPGQPTAEDVELEEHADLPNSYCEIMVSKPGSCCSCGF